MEKEKEYIIKYCYFNQYESGWSGYIADQPYDNKSNLEWFKIKIPIPYKLLKETIEVKIEESE